MCSNSCQEVDWKANRLDEPWKCAVCVKVLYVSFVRMQRSINVCFKNPKQLGDLTCVPLCVTWMQSNHFFPRKKPQNSSCKNVTFVLLFRVRVSPLWHFTQKSLQGEINDPARGNLPPAVARRTWRATLLTSLNDSLTWRVSLERFGFVKWNKGRTLNVKVAHISRAFWICGVYLGCISTSKGNS